MTVLKRQSTILNKSNSNLVFLTLSILSAKTSGSVFGERIEKVKNTKVDLDLFKIVDSFLKRSL